MPRVPQLSAEPIQSLMKLLQLAADEIMGGFVGVESPRLNWTFRDFLGRVPPHLLVGGFAVLLMGGLSAYAFMRIESSSSACVGRYGPREA